MKSRTSIPSRQGPSVNPCHASVGASGVAGLVVAVIVATPCVAELRNCGGLDQVKTDLSAKNAVRGSDRAWWIGGIGLSMPSSP
jgi:ABC-type proline/glycine betaine transport system permease subunit